MSQAEFDALVLMVSRWENFHENPTHVMDFLKKIGGSAWKAFKWSAPHLMRAAGAAMAGSTPAGALMAALSHIAH